MCFQRGGDERCVAAASELTAIAEGGGRAWCGRMLMSEMLLTGPAEIICRGEAFVSACSRLEAGCVAAGSDTGCGFTGERGEGGAGAGGDGLPAGAWISDEVMPHALGRGPLYYAGTAEQRAGDLMAAFADPEIDGILCTRGGWGSAELLPLLDAEVIRANPKVFVGYSDHTSLHVWMAREAGLVTFYAPMVAADFARAEGQEKFSWRHAMEGSANWSLGEERRVARPAGRAWRKGRLQGVAFRSSRRRWGRHMPRCRRVRMCRGCCFWRTLGPSRTSGTGCCCICGMRGCWSMWAGLCSET